jgi:hypothetical protein
MKNQLVVISIYFLGYVLAFVFLLFCFEVGILLGLSLLATIGVNNQPEAVVTLTRALNNISLTSVYIVALVFALPLAVSEVYLWRWATESSRGRHEKRGIAELKRSN